LNWKSALVQAQVMFELRCERVNITITLREKEVGRTGYHTRAVMQARAQGQSAVPAMALALAPAAEPKEALEDTAMLLLEAAEFLMLCGVLALCGGDWVTAAEKASTSEEAHRYHLQ
jgi:hypothetical protein